MRLTITILSLQEQPVYNVLLKESFIKELEKYNKQPIAMGVYRSEHQTYSVGAGAMHLSLFQSSKICRNMVFFKRRR